MIPHNDEFNPQTEEDLRRLEEDEEFRRRVRQEVRRIQSGDADEDIERDIAEEQSEREEAEDEMEIIETAVSNLKKFVNVQGGNLDLGMDVVLDTCDNDHTDNLEVSALSVYDGELWGKTNWGLLNLQDTIQYSDDWLTLEDIVRDLI